MPRYRYNSGTVVTTRDKMPLKIKRLPKSKFFYFKSGSDSWKICFFQ